MAEVHSNGILRNQLYALEEISRLPLPLAEPLYSHYPGMKLGVLACVDYFSALLVEKAFTLIKRKAENSETAQPWIISSPPYFELPAAANLLAVSVHQKLCLRGVAVELRPLRLSAPNPAQINQEHFVSTSNYSRSGLAARIVERERVQLRLLSDQLLDDLARRRVLMINDINVTGTQRHYLELTLSQALVMDCQWLCIFNVAASLAQTHPEVEHQINSSQLSELRDYLAILEDRTVQHTAMCVSRLFALGVRDFSNAVEQLSISARARMHQLALNERRYSGPLFAERLALLAECSASPALSAH